MRAWQRESPATHRPVVAAAGEVEFPTDGTAIHTTRGGREVRLSLFAKGPGGGPVTDLDAWDEDRLPAPSLRVATATIRTSAA